MATEWAMQNDDAWYGDQTSAQYPEMMGLSINEPAKPDVPEVVPPPPQATTTTNTTDLARGHIWV